MNKLENKVEREPWKPTVRETLIPFSGSKEYAYRWTNYFYDKGWTLMSINEERKEIEINPSFADSEQYLTSKKFHRIQCCLALRDALSAIIPPLAIYSLLKYLGVE